MREFCVENENQNIVHVLHASVNGTGFLCCRILTAIQMNGEEQLWILHPSPFVYLSTNFGLIHFYSYNNCFPASSFLWLWTKRIKLCKYQAKNYKFRRCRGSNPDRPRDRRKYLPLYYNDLDDTFQIQKILNNFYFKMNPIYISVIFNLFPLAILLQYPHVTAIAKDLGSNLKYKLKLFCELLKC